MIPLALIAFAVILYSGSKSKSPPESSDANAYMTGVGYRDGVAQPVSLMLVNGKWWLQVTAAKAFLNMQAAYGRTIELSSAFRTYEEQSRLRQLYLDGKGYEAARPGYSNHQQGLSADIPVKQNPELLAWLRTNAQAFGFVNDVPSEPHHWTYKGAV